MVSHQTKISPENQKVNCHISGAAVEINLLNPTEMQVRQVKLIAEGCAHDDGACDETCTLGNAYFELFQRGLIKKG